MKMATPYKRQPSWVLKCCILLIAVGFSIRTQAQQDQNPPFWSDILAFKAQDSVQAPPQGAILFIGSSTFTRWKDYQSYFPGYTIINRGFGGSTLPDVTRYVDDIVTPYHPKEVIIYCGENDIADSLDSKVVADHFKDLFNLIRARVPGVPIAFISMKPSPVRVGFRHTLTQANQIIKNFLYTQTNTMYINVFDVMLDPAGNYRTDIFVNDSLHLNPSGYAILAKAITPYLLK
jgi:lysophospholipase L1-like esterase